MAKICSKRSIDVYEHQDYEHNQKFETNECDGADDKGHEDKNEKNDEKNQDDDDDEDADDKRNVVNHEKDVDDEKIEKDQIKPILAADDLQNVDRYIVKRIIGVRVQVHSISPE